MTGSGGMATTIGNYLFPEFAAFGDEFVSILYKAPPAKHNECPYGETDMPQVNQPRKKTNTMGDRSPKSNRKKSNQKQAQANSASQKKKAAEAAKSAAGKKR